MTTRSLRWLVGAGLCGLLASSSTRASATPEFPGVVEQTLGLTSLAIDPPQGCTLCHTSDAGGTSLRAFGELLLQYGTQPYEDSTLEQALAEVDQNEPQLITDIKAGRDPNDDPNVAPLPTPEYGCNVAAKPRSPAIPSPALIVVAAGGALVVRSARGRRRRRRRGEAPAPRSVRHPSSSAWPDRR
jgi:hypothetical protein